MTRTNLPSKLRALTSWRRYAVACLFGALAALAFPPFNAIPVLWLSFPALVFLLQGAPDKKSAFALSWTFAFGMLTVSLYWIAGALFVDIDQFWWLVPFAACGLPAMFAVYHGLAGMAAWRWGVNRLDGLLFLALAWTLADYARGTMMTGFPWDLTGYVWGDVLPVLQITSLTGIYGLTLITLTLAVMPAALAAPIRSVAGKRCLLACFVTLGVIAGWGLNRLSGARDNTVPDVRLRLIQPDTKQSQKWITAKRETNFQTLLELTSLPNEKLPAAIIWPETASTFYLAEDTPHRQSIAANLEKNQTVLTGAIRRGVNEKQELVYFNALIAIDNLARVTADYAKFHLVPFGEYVPFRKYLPFRAVAAVGDFTPGEGLQTLRIEGLPPFSPLICYEAIFPGEVARRDDPPQWLLNVTNDAWYDGTTGPYQHFAIVRVRAVEEGIPLVRVANKGINGVIDAYGRITIKQGWGQKGIIDSNLPEALPKRTFFARWGNRPFWILCGLMLGAALLLRCKNRTK